MDKTLNVRSTLDLRPRGVVNKWVVTYEDCCSTRRCQSLYHKVLTGYKLFRSPNMPSVPTDVYITPLLWNYLAVRLFDSCFTLIFQREPYYGAGQFPLWELSTLVAFFDGGCAHGALSGSRIGWWGLVPSSDIIGIDFPGSAASGVACQLT